VIARENADGSVTVPLRAEADDGMVGDAIAVLRPGDDGYADALAEARRFAGELDRARES
jgi:hypothetical protein